MVDAVDKKRSTKKDGSVPMELAELIGISGLITLKNAAARADGPDQEKGARTKCKDVQHLLK